MAKFSPRNNKRKKKTKARGRSRRGIGARGIGAEGGSYDLCAPAWAALLIGGFAAYGIAKAVQR